MAKKTTAKSEPRIQRLLRLPKQKDRQLVQLAGKIQGDRGSPVSVQSLIEAGVDLILEAKGKRNE